MGLFMFISIVLWLNYSMVFTIVVYAALVFLLRPQGMLILGFLSLEDRNWVIQGTDPGQLSKRKQD
jgi:hypothetical protein